MKYTYNMTKEFQYYVVLLKEIENSPNYTLLVDNFDNRSFKYILRHNDILKRLLKTHRDILLEIGAYGQGSKKQLCGKIVFGVLV